MTSSLSLWTSESTDVMESKVARIIRAAGDFNSVYDSVSIVGCDTTNVVAKLNQAFDNLVSMTMSDASLHILAIIPLWEKKSIQQINGIADGCAAFKHNCTLHIIGLGAGLQRLFDAEFDYAKTSDEGIESALKSLTDKSTSEIFPFSFSIIDDYADNGAPIGFTIDSLSKYIATFQMALMQDYYKLLSPSILSSHLGDNISIGMSSIAFDKKRTANQMLDLGFLSVLDDAGINDKEVDAQKAVVNAENILRGIDKRFESLYNDKIKSLIKRDDFDEGTAIAKASPIIDENLDELKKAVAALLDDNNLSLPEKEAIFALILGRDNKNISGLQYDHEGMLLDDAIDEPINIYVNAYNESCLDSGLLPTRGNYPFLKAYTYDAEKEDLVEDEDENKKALNPLSEIKKLKQDILNISSVIRDKNKELGELHRMEGQREEVKRIEQKWHRPKGNLEDVVYKEQPLDEKYQPSSEIRPATSIDLRKFFSAVRNQKHLGSCTSFATAAMYEALMNKNSLSDTKNSMSPAYLYYYSNVEKGRPSGGSNFYEQLEVLGKHGVCHEDLYAYNPDNPSIRPSQAADDDASAHRVLKAKQIPLSNDTNRMDSINKNHHILTCALTEGYPVGISLKLYDNFGKNGAIVLHPEDSTDIKEDGWHAMVIVGYSEENGFYIVRNSWGEDFGDSGYCYIPSAYIDDPNYLDFACIITEITDAGDASKVEIPALVVNFDVTESEIKMAAIRNVVQLAKIELESLQNLYAEYYKYYQRLVQQLTLPSVLKQIRTASEETQGKRNAELYDLKRIKEDTYVDKLKQHKRLLLKAILGIFTTAILLGGIYALTEWNTCGIIAIVLCVIGVFLSIDYKWDIRRKRRQLQDELGEISQELSRQNAQLKETKFKYHIAGMWLNKFHKISLEINNTYDRLVSFNECLREWQKNYKDEVSKQEESEDKMFINIDSASLLQPFFETHKNEIIKGIDLLKVFEDYRISVDTLEKSHDALKDMVRDTIMKLLADFNMAEFLLGREYPYLEPVEIEDIIGKMLAVGRPSYRNNYVLTTTPMNIILTDVSSTEEYRWDNAVARYFSMQPQYLPLNDSTKLIVLTLLPISIKPVN